MTSTGRAPYFVAIAPGFVRHPKLLRLGAVADRWRWLEVLCYCAEYGTEGRVDATVGEVVRGASSAYLRRCVEVGLLDELDAGELYVHSWDEFNGTARERLLSRERKRRQREAEKLEREGSTAGRSFGSAVRQDGRFRHGDVTRGRDMSVTDVTLHARASTSTSTSKELSTQTSTVDAEISETSEDRLGVGSELLAVRLIAAGGLEDTRAEYVRGAVSRLPESVSAGVLELVNGGHARDKGAYVIGALHKELERRGL